MLLLLDLGHLLACQKRWPPQRSAWPSGPPFPEHDSPRPLRGAPWSGTLHSGSIHLSTAMQEHQKWTGTWCPPKAPSKTVYGPETLTPSPREPGDIERGHSQQHRLQQWQRPIWASRREIWIRQSGWRSTASKRLQFPARRVGPRRHRICSQVYVRSGPNFIHKINHS